MKPEDELSTPIVSVLPTTPIASTSALKIDDLPPTEAQEQAPPLDVPESSDTTDVIKELKDVGIVAWIEQRLAKDMSPSDMLRLLGIHLPDTLPDGIDDFKLLKNVLAKIMRKRDKRDDINNLEDALQLIRQAKNILVLTGAGVSTSCGIPDFRSANGIYARIYEETRGLLNDPQEMFDIDFFRENPSVFYSFAHELYPSNFRPSATHRFLRVLEERNQLLRNYSQNIDTLEAKAGISRVLNCHGSFATASCLSCGHQVPGETIEAEIFARQVPLCSRCPIEPDTRPPPAKKRKLKPWEDDDDEDDDGYAPSEWLDKPIMKPDITFFGEKLRDTFGEYLLQDRQEVDLLLVIGTSLKVAPVAEVTSHIPHRIPQILINRDPVPHNGFDIVMLGNCDGIVRWIVDQLGWPQLDTETGGVEQEPTRVSDSHVWLFEGGHAEHPWVKKLQSDHDRAFHA